MKTRSSFARPPRCRFCGSLMDDGFRYGPAHYAHFDCFLESDRTLASLPPGKIEEIPWHLLLEHGRLAEAELILGKARGVTEKDYDT